MKVAHIYLDEERYNPRVRATIPAAWMVEFECGAILSICCKYDAANDIEAEKILMQRDDIDFS